jgi:hypothetical protein
MLSINGTTVELREVRIATSTVREADSTRKRVRVASTSHSAKRSKQPDLATELGSGPLASSKKRNFEDVDSEVDLFWQQIRKRKRK